MLPPHLSSDPAALQALCAGPAVADPEDEASWDALGTLVLLLMRDSQVLRPGRPAGSHPVTEVFQYWDEAIPPADVSACLDSWRGAGIPVRRYDHEAAEEYLRQHFGPEVLAAFRYAHHPSMQSDILRMARLFQDGGLYVDADDLFLGSGPIPPYAAGASLLPLAVCRSCPASLVPRTSDGAAHLAWYYLGSAPWFSVARHPFVGLSLERAVAAVAGRERKGELCRIHNDVGPGCVSMAALDYVRDCLRSGREIDLQLSPGWAFVEQSRPLAYKSTPRNWRSNSVLYGPARTSADPPPATADGV